ncbi:hypothetical protein Slin14017_G122830 [Septoria linicola]|nr:hypothetical protein Slin14017_G122830 [Septoria linicola]
MAPAPQVLGGITNVLGGAAAPAAAVSSVAAAATAAPALVSSLAANVPIASAVPANVPLSGVSLPNLAIPTGTVLEVTALTTVPLASTSVISALAALPVNFDVPGLGNLLDALSGLPLPTAALASNLPLSLLPTNVISILPADLPLSLPLNAPLSALPTGILTSLPSGLPADLPISALPIQLPSLPTGLPLIPLQAISPVQAILTNLGETLITQLTSQLSNIIATIAAAAANVPVAGSATSLLPGLGRMKDADSETEEQDAEAVEKRQVGNLLGGSSPVSGVTNLLSGLTGGSGSSPLAALGSLTGLTSALTGGILANSNPLGFLTGSNVLAPLTDGTVLPVGSIIGGLTGQSGGSILAGLQGSLGGSLTNGLGLAGNNVNPLAGIQNTVQGAVSGLAGGAASGEPLGAVSGLVSGLSLSGGPLSSVTGVLGNLGLGSIVLNVVNTLPIPASFGNIINGLAAAIAAPISVVLSTAQLTQLQSVLGLLNLFSSLNIGNLGVLSGLTNLPAIQTAATQLNTQDLLTTLSILQNPTLVPGGAGVGSLLSNPSDLLNVVQKIVPRVQNPSAASAFVILEQLNLGGLADLTSALPVSGALSGVTGSLGGSAGAAGGLTGASGGLTGGAGAGATASGSAGVAGSSRMME